MNATDLTMPVLGGGRVLVVDGDDDSAAALTAMLRLHGFSAHAARNPAEAFAAMQTQQPHAVVLDPALLGLDWRKTARRIRSMEPSPGLVIVTGDTDSRLIRGAMDLGAEGFFLKPSEPQDLVKLLHDLCDGKPVG